MAAKIQSPSGEIEDAELTESQDCLYQVHFVPKELGVHIISVKHKEVHIPGSPFPFTVGPMDDFGSHKVHAGGLGLERATCSEQCLFSSFHFYSFFFCSIGKQFFTFRLTFVFFLFFSFFRRIQCLDS